jgi:hypothetical protein
MMQRIWAMEKESEEQDKEAKGWDELQLEYELKLQ